LNKRNRHDDYNAEFFDTSEHKKFLIKYLNPKQKEYGRLIQENTIIFAIGSAGSGKTLVATLHAMEYFISGKIDKIVICRPAINAGGEKLGYLPGTLNEKMDPYIQPIFDAFSSQWSSVQIKTLMKYGKIEVVPLGFMRGRTLKNSFVLCDEAQNCTSDQLLMLLTRIGDNSKMVITGDYMQRDIAASGLITAKKYLKFIPNIAFIEFGPSEIVRHPIVAEILKAWPKSELQYEYIDDTNELPSFIKN
jgi:phosphate starvation-inducible protein PhoH and related proteins